MKTIRLIHNLPRSGGTIISKSLGAQKDVVLLSEIHPEGVTLSKKMSINDPVFDPVYQCQLWNNLFKNDEYKKICSSNLKFIEKIDLIYEKVELAKKKLIIRDWAFFDFIGKPFIEPSYKNSLLETLNKNYKILNFYIIRHPLKYLESCLNKWIFFRRDNNFIYLIKGYKNYLLNASEGNICVFENFIGEPEKNLGKMCGILEIDYDQNFLDKLKDVNLTGDSTAKKSIEIHNKHSLTKKKLLKEEDLNKIKKHPDFMELMQDLKSYY